jgi:hypothetical protein
MPFLKGIKEQTTKKYGLYKNGISFQTPIFTDLPDETKLSIYNEKDYAIYSIGKFSIDLGYIEMQENNLCKHLKK